MDPQTHAADSGYCEMVISDDLALRYLRNVLPNKERDDFEQHYFRCEACTNVIRVLEPLVSDFPVPGSGVPERVGSALDRQRILDALEKTNGNQTRAARHLGIPRRTFVTLLDQYSIARPQRVWATDPTSTADPRPAVPEGFQPAHVQPGRIESNKRELLLHEYDVCVSVFKMYCELATKLITWLFVVYAATLAFYSLELKSVAILLVPSTMAIVFALAFHAGITRANEITTVVEGVRRDLEMPLDRTVKLNVLASILRRGSIALLLSGLATFIFMGVEIVKHAVAH
jgi:hypothetical protein